MKTVKAHDTCQTTEGNAAIAELPNALKASPVEVLIPLKRLVASPYNQRKKKRDPASIEAIADNILAVGLLQNLVVHAMKVSAKKAQTYGVDAGETRRQALLLNVERGHISADFQVRCIVITEAEAILASASENELRVPPHPADQFIAYKALADEGRSPEFIAAVFKVTPKLVAGYLKLASVSPRLFDLFANDEMNLDQIKALAMTDDHQRQETAWFDAKQPWARQPHELRAVLKGDGLTLGDRMVKFVTVEAYEAAGGVVERDLFAERDDGFILDRDVLNRLFDAKVASHVETIKAEGWAWVEARPRFEYGDRNGFAQLYAEPAPLTADEQARYDQLEKRAAELSDRMDSLESADEGEDANVGDEAWQAVSDEFDRVTQAIEEMDGREGNFTAEQMKVGGAIVSIGHNGELEVVRGLVRREDRAEARAMMEDCGADVPHSLTRKVKGVHSEKLLLNLTAHRTAAVQSALSQNPQVALVALVHKLALEYLYTGSGFDRLSVAQISAREVTYDLARSAPDLEQTRHASGLRSYVESWRALLPKNPNLLFGWLLEQAQDRLLNLLALCTSLSINGVARDEGPNAVNAIAGALHLNLSAYWQPTRTSYLNHVSKDRIVTVVSDAVSREEAARLAKMKKGEAAQAAEKLLEGKNWLPEFMASAQVAEARFYDGECDDANDECQHAAPDHADADYDEGDCGEPAGAEALRHAEGKPWPFPKAADFETAGAAVSEPNSGPHVDEPRTATVSPVSAWPFPMTNPRALRAVRQVA